jgi:Cys-rich repeat protein
MMKHSIALLVATVTLALSGCELYFGEEENNGSWNYCGSDGYYECSDNDCYWRGPECPSGGTSGSGSSTPGGFECDDNSDCAAGCYCDNGLCEEAGFCTQDSDCGTGYSCDESRSSCEPDGCATDSDCASGEYCDPATLNCTATCTCATDADAVAGGYDYCDESRGTCLPGIDPAGTCAGEVTCNQIRPSCPAGQVALILDGCYTGSCQAIAACEASPVCEAYGTDDDCRADSTCASSYTGTNCKKPDMSPCQAGDTNCTCASYQFAACHDGATARTVEFDGFRFPVPSELTLRN